MNAFLLILSLAASLAASETPHKEYEFQFGQHSRRYLVHAPAGVGGKSTAPVVLLLHGGGGNAGSLVQSSGMDAIAKREGFITVYPEGTGRKLGSKRFSLWNAGLCCGKAKDENVDDVGYLTEVIRRVKRDYRVDAGKVFMTGHSNGAMMAYRFACERPELVSAIAPVGSVGDARDCRPKTPLSILHIHGKSDACARFDGGEDCGGCYETFFRSFGLTRFKQKRHACESAPDHMTRWIKNLGCAENPARVEQRGPAACSFHENCAGGGTVGYCFIEGVGHAWPGSSPRDVTACRRRPEGKICRVWVETGGPYTAEFSASEAIWNFFSAR